MPHRGVMYLGVLITYFIISIKFLCILSLLDYYSGEGQSYRGCIANAPFRKSLLALVYSDERGFDMECETTNEESQDEQLSPSMPINKPSDHKTSSSISIGMRFASMHLGN